MHEAFDFGPDDILKLIHGNGLREEADGLEDILNLEGLWPRGKGPVVERLHVEGLDATQPDHFRSALDSLRAQIREAVKESKNRSPFFALTGGYKGTVAATLLYAFSERQNRAADPDAVRAFYLHEQSPSLIELPCYPGARFRGDP